MYFDSNLKAMLSSAGSARAHLEAVTVDAEQVLLHHQDADRIAPGGGRVLAGSQQEGQVDEYTGIGRCPHRRPPFQ